jgi:ribosomal protein S18 acetylase RimI-like enzyme
MNAPAGESILAVELRQAVSEDEPFFARVFESTIEAKFAGLPLDPAMKRSLVEMQYRALTQSRQQAFPYARRQLVLVDGTPAGYCWTHISEGRMRLVDIALLPSFRNRGVGATLLGRLLAEADASGFDVDLHVELENPARRLYERFGFTVISQEGPYLTMQRIAARQES